MANFITGSVIGTLGLLVVLFSFWCKAPRNQKITVATLRWCNGERNVDMGKYWSPKIVKHHATFCYTYRVNNKQYERINQANVNYRTVPKKKEFMYIKGFPGVTYKPGVQIWKIYLVIGTIWCVIGALLIAGTFL